MRDHTKLRAFELADEVAMLVYRVTAGFPKEELCWGLRSWQRGRWFITDWTKGRRNREGLEWLDSFLARWFV